MKSVVDDLLTAYSWIQCYGSGTRIRTDSALLDPDPYWDCGSRKEQEITKITKKTDSSLPKRLSCLRRYRVFYDLLPTSVKNIFHVITQTFCDCKVWPGPGSALVWILNPDPHWDKSWIRSRIEPKADPQHCWKLKSKMSPLSHITDLGFSQTSTVP